MDSTSTKRVKRRKNKFKLVIVEPLLTPHTSGDAGKSYSYNYWQAFANAPPSQPAPSTVDADLIDHQVELAALKAEYDVRHITTAITQLHKDVVFFSHRNGAFASDLRTEDDHAIIEYQKQELSMASYNLRDLIFHLQHFKPVVSRDVIAHQRMVEGDIIKKRLSWVKWHMQRPDAPVRSV